MSAVIPVFILFLYIALPALIIFFVVKAYLRLMGQIDRMQTDVRGIREHLEKNENGGRT